MIVVKKLIWESWNVKHIARHGVTPEEVEQVCGNPHLSFQSRENRMLIIGKTNADRLLRLILDPELEEGVWYPVTAFPASRKDRRIYKEHTQKEAA